MKNNDLNQKTCKTCGAPISYRKQNFQLQKEGLNSQRSYSNGQAAIGNIYENHWHGEIMSSQLDIDDVCAGSPKAESELTDMRERIKELESVLLAVTKWAENVPVEYGSSLIEASIKTVMS